jgi:molybdopterin-guanine dinucleotide biosynthesis protein A
MRQAASTAPAGFPGVAGCVLAGGRSSRMGRDKATIRLPGPDGSATLLERTLALFDGLCGTAYVSVRQGSPACADLSEDRLVFDEGPEIGPMGGILSVLGRAGRDGFEAVLFLACDLPFAGREHLVRLLRQRELRPEGTLVTALRRDEASRPEPLCAVWETASLPLLEKARDQGRFSLSRALPEARWQAVGCPPGGGELGLFNMNTPADLAQALTRHRE